MKHPASSWKQAPSILVQCTRGAGSLAPPLPPFSGAGHPGAVFIHPPPRCSCFPLPLPEEVPQPPYSRKRVSKLFEKAKNYSNVFVHQLSDLTPLRTWWAVFFLEPIERSKLQVLVVEITLNLSCSPSPSLGPSFSWFGTC